MMSYLILILYYDIPIWLILIYNTSGNELSLSFLVIVRVGISLQVDSIFDEVDTDRSGLIDFPEFVRGVAKFVLEESRDTGTRYYRSGWNSFERLVS